MKILFDSSALIGAFVESHPKHKSALSFLLKAKRNEFELFVASHSLLEIYSVLTSAPFKPRITPKIAKLLIENNINNLARIIYLTDKEYFRLIEKLSDLNISGGIVYDALIVECAKKAKVDEILTLNTKDFIHLTTDLSIKVNSI